jgi:hypothetical protein
MHQNAANLFLQNVLWTSIPQVSSDVMKTSCWQKSLPHSTGWMIDFSTTLHPVEETYNQSLLTASRLLPHLSIFSRCYPGCKTRGRCAPCAVVNDGPASPRAANSGAAIGVAAAVGRGGVCTVVGALVGIHGRESGGGRRSRGGW